MPDQTYDPSEYGGHLMRARLVTDFLLTIPLQEMQDQCERAEALGPILHTTLYRQKAEALAFDRKLLTILANAKRELDKLYREAQSRRAKAEAAS